MFTFFLVVHAIIAAALVTVILMQRSEGGGLGMGGSPSGLMSARGAADFLTRATTVLATVFVVMSIGLAALATVQGGPRKIDASLARPGAPAIPAAPAEAPAAAPGSAVPFEGDPLTGAAAAVPGATPATAPAVPAAREKPAGTTRVPKTGTSRKSETGSRTSSSDAPATTTPPAARPNSPSVPGAINTAPTGNSSTPQ